MMQQQTTHKPTIKRGSLAHTYNVESQTKAGIFYTVNVATGHCSCPAGKHSRLCWHLGTALAYDAWRQQQSSVIPTTPPVAPAMPPSGALGIPRDGWLQRAGRVLLGEEVNTREQSP